MDSHTTETLLRWIVLVPLLGAATVGLLNRRLPRNVAGLLACVAGTAVADPYRWLEDDVRESDRVAGWIRTQNEVTFDYLGRIPELARERLSAATQVRHSVTQVRDLLKRPPVTIAQDASIREAATLMSRENVSSVLVMEEDTLAGIVTDKDLRQRVIAASRDTAQPIREVMTDHPMTLQADSGEVLWRAERPVSLHRPAFSSPTLVAKDGVVLTADRAAKAAAKLRLAIAAVEPGKPAHRETLTASLGVQSIEHAAMIADLINQADDRLYQAKNSGRNRVVAGYMNRTEANTG